MNAWTLDDIKSFLEDFARWNPSQETTDSTTELMKTLMQSCRKQTMRNEIAAGSKTDQAVNAIWAVMVYHTPALNQALKTYGNPRLLSVVIELKLFHFLLYFMIIFSLCFVSAWVVNQDCKSCLSEDFVQVYSLADSIRTWMVSILTGFVSVEYLLQNLCLTMPLSLMGSFSLSVGDEAEIPSWQNDCFCWEGRRFWWGYHGDIRWGPQLI